MALERVGFRQVYEALGVTVLEQGEIVRTFEFPDGGRAEAVIGPKPRRSFSVRELADYIIPGGTSKLGGLQFAQTPEQAGLTARCLTDILLTRPVDVSDDLARAFRANEQGSSNAMQAFLRPLERELRAQVELVAGFLGLKLHRQLVLRLVTEEWFAYRDPQPPELYIHGHAAEVLEPITFNPSPASDPINLNAGKGLVRGLTAMPWLLRAWHTREPVSKFTTLFIPLEVCLGGIDGYVDPKLLEAAALLRAFITATESMNSVAGINQADLFKAIEALTRNLQPSLVSRFETLATEAKLPGWEDDIQAFIRFYRIRNALFHRGNRDVQLILKPEEAEGLAKKEVVYLEDLVERYVSFRLLGDANVYPSRWFPNRPFAS